MGALKRQTLRKISGDIIDAECQVDRHCERLFGKGFKAAALAGSPGAKRSASCLELGGSIGRRGRTKSIARGGNEFFRNHFVRSFERPKGKTLLIASRIDSSKVGRGSLLSPPVPSFDRSDAVFARPLTPLFKGFQNADAAEAVAGGRVLSALVVPNDRRPKKGINPPACLAMLAMISIGSDSTRLHSSLQSFTETIKAHATNVNSSRISLSSREPNLLWAKQNSTNPTISRRAVLKGQLNNGHVVSAREAHVHSAWN